MSRPDGGPARPEIRAQGLPVYLALDVSKSMQPHEEILNRTLAEILNVLYTSPRISEFVHLSILTFGSRPGVVVGMTELEGLAGIPRVECRGATYFAPLFRLLRERIELDVPRLAERGVRPLRPVVFLLTDGAPADRPDGAWEEAFGELTDADWRPHPHIVTYGFGTAVESVLGRMATVAAFAAVPGAETDGEALTTALGTVLNSLVASAQAQAMQVPEQVRGYRSLPLEHIDF